MSRIVFHDVAKRFGEVSVIEDFNLEVRDRELLVLVGPSGCGKSTALRLIAGLEELSAGSLTIGDRVVNEVHPKDRDVAMVFQSYALYPHMTVRENIAFGLRMRGVAGAEIERRVSETAVLLGLAPLLDRRPKALSGGQRQRVALGRAIVRKPAVFLFDEPLSNLDAELRVQMRAEIAKLQRQLETTTVYVTHDQVEAMTLGHRIAVMAPIGDRHSGNLQQVGSPLELYERPENVFVARFLGSPPMNVLNVTVNRDATRLEASGFPSPVPESLRAALRPLAGQRVLMGIRPESLCADAAEDWALGCALQGTVEIVETIGYEVIVHARCGDDLIVARVAARRIPALGDQIRLTMNVGTMHVFDPRTEQRLAG